jgi:hypothetical protein
MRVQWWDVRKVLEPNRDRRCRRVASNIETHNMPNFYGMVALQVDEMEKAVDVAEKNMSRYGLDAGEIASRRRWVQQTRRQVGSSVSLIGFSANPFLGPCARGCRPWGVFLGGGERWMEDLRRLTCGLPSVYHQGSQCLSMCSDPSCAICELCTLRYSPSRKSAGAASELDMSSLAAFLSRFLSELDIAVDTSPVGLSHLL